MPSSLPSSSAEVRAEPALVDHGRTPHAAHYMYDDPRRGHDLENWIIAAPTKPTQAEVIALGVTPDAEYHSGFLRGGVQHWTWIARRPLSDVPCAICGDPAEAIDALAEALRLGPIPPTAVTTLAPGFDRLATVTARLDSYVRDRLAAACYERSAVDADDRDNLPATELLDRLLDYYATVELELACTEESVKRLRAENRTLAMALEEQMEARIKEVA